jgi:hypothetical protein
MKTAYALISEWDVGEAALVFATKERGMQWLVEHPLIESMAADAEDSEEGFVKACFEEGYFDWMPLEIIE